MPSATGDTRKPTPAAQRLSGAPISRYAVPTPSSRSMWIGVVSLKETASPYSDSSKDAITSFCTSPYRLTVMSSAFRTRISGSCSASWVSAWKSLTRSRALTTVSSVGGANNRPAPRAGTPS